MNENNTEENKKRLEKIVFTATEAYSKSDELAEKVRKSLPRKLIKLNDTAKIKNHWWDNECRL